MAPNDALTKRTRSPSILSSHLELVQMHMTLLEKGKIKTDKPGTLEEIPVAEDVVWIYVVLDRLQHPHADAGDGLSHPLLPKFPH